MKPRKPRRVYNGPRLPRSPEASKRFRVYYYRLAGTDEYAIKQDTSGSTNELSQAYRLAAGHCSASELRRDEYAKAIVIDAHLGRFLRVYTKDTDAIRIKEY